MMEANFTADSIREWSGKIVNPVLKRLDEVMKIVLKSKKDTCVPVTKFEMVTESTIKVFHGSRSTVIPIDWLNIDLGILQEMFDSYDVLKEKAWNAILDEIPKLESDVKRAEGRIRMYQNGLANLSNPRWIESKKQELLDHVERQEKWIEKTKNETLGKRRGSGWDDDRDEK